MAPTRQRPEEILAATLSAAPHPAATDGWSARGRRIFLVAMAAAGVVLVVAGLLVTKELAPRPGNPAPVQSGPGNGLADQLLQSSGGETPTTTPFAGTPPALPLPPAPAARQTSTGGPAPTPVAPAPAVPAKTAAGATPPPSSSPATPTTTIPCGGLLTKGLQQAQINLPCSAGSSSPLGGL